MTRLGHDMDAFADQGIALSGSELAALAKRMTGPGAFEEYSARYFKNREMPPELLRTGIPPVRTQGAPQLMTRAAVAELDLEAGYQRLIDHNITTRQYPIRASSMDVEGRSVEGVIASDEPVRVFDWKTFDLIDEILVISGMRQPPNNQVVLLESHRMFSNENVLGSTREIRAEAHQVIGRSFFSSVPSVDEQWTKVREGHLRDFSIGYQVFNHVDIAAGTSAEVDGQRYTAKELTLRISTDWMAFENSLVPIGADITAKVRSARALTAKKEPAMDPKFQAWLEQRRLNTEDLTEEGLQRQQAAWEAEVTAAEEAVRAAAERGGDDAELARQRQIRSLAGDDERQKAVAETCVLEGTTFEDARQRLLAAWAERHKPVGTSEPTPPAPEGDPAEDKYKDVDATMVARAFNSLSYG